MGRQPRVQTVARAPTHARIRAANTARRPDPRTVARQNAIAIQARIAQNKINVAAQKAKQAGIRRAQKTRSAVLKAASLRGNTRTKKQLVAEANRQAANAIKSGNEKAARIRKAGQVTVKRITSLAPTQANVFAASIIQGGISTKKSRQKASAAASVTAARSGGVASQAFATGGSIARTAGQEKAAAVFSSQQSKTSTARARKSSTLTQKAPTVTRQKVVGLQVFGSSKTVFAPAIPQKKVVKVKTKTLTGPTSSQVQKNAQLKAAQLDIQRKFPDAVSKATGLTTQQVRNLTIQGKTIVPTSRTTVKKITKVIKSSEEKKQQIRDLGLTPTEKTVTLVNTPAVQVIDDTPIGQQNVFDPNVSQGTGISTPQDKSQSLQDQGLAIGDVAPDGLVSVLRTNGKVSRVTPKTAQGLVNRGLIATGFDVETTFHSGDLAPPQAIDIKSKPLIAPTRDQTVGFGVLGDIAIKGGTPIEKTKAQLREETLAFRAGQSPNVNLFDIAVDRRSKGEILGPGESISRDGVALQGTELQAVLRIREEQDVARIANALQAQKFQALTGAKSGVQVLAGLKKQEDLGLQTIIEPQFTFGTQQAAEDVPFFEDRERIGGVDSIEKLALVQQRLDETPRPSLKETLGFGIPVSSVETKFTPRELSKVTTGNEQGIGQFGFSPAAIETGIIPKAEGSLISIPNPTETFNGNVLGSVKNQFGGFNFLQSQSQDKLAVQSLTKKQKEAGEGGFTQDRFDFLTQELTPQQARDFKFTKEDSVVTKDIGSPFGLKLGLNLGQAATGIFVQGALGGVNLVSRGSQLIGGPDFLGPVRNQLGDLGTTFAADIENEVIGIQNIKNIPGAVSDVATGKIGGGDGFIPFNPTPQDLLIGGLIESGIGSAVARPIVTTPNAQGLVSAQLKDGTVLENITVQRAQGLADNKELKTFGGGGTEQFKTEQSLLFSNLGVLAKERPLAFAGSALEFAGATVVGVKAISLGSKLAKGGLAAARGNRSAKINRAISKELPSVNIPTDIPKVSTTVSNVAEITAKTQKSGPDVLTGGAFGKAFKDLFKRDKTNFENLPSATKNRLVNEVLENNKKLGTKGTGLGSKTNVGGFTKTDAENLVKSTVNRKRPINDLGLGDSDLRTQEILFKRNQPIISISKDQPFIQQQFDIARGFAAKKRGGLKEIGPGKALGIEEKLVQDSQASSIFRSNLQKAIDKAKGGTTATTGKKPPPPPTTPKTVNALIKQYSTANNVTERVAKKQLSSSGAIKKGARGSDVLGATSKKAANDIRVIQDINKGRISIDVGRDILQSSERAIPKATSQTTTLLTPKGKLKVISNEFTGVLVNNKLKQVPTKIIRKGDDFLRVPQKSGLDDLGKITNVKGIFQRTTQFGKGGIDDLGSLGTTARRSLKASGQIFEDVGEESAKKGAKGGGQILKRPKVKPPKENPTLKQLRKGSDGGIGKLPKAFDDFKVPTAKGSKLFGIITPKLITRVDKDLSQADDLDFGQAIDIKQSGLQSPASSLDFFGQTRARGRFRQQQAERLNLRSSFAPRLAGQFSFDFGEGFRPRTFGRARIGGPIIPGGRAEVGFDSRDNAQRFFRVFDVGRDKKGNPVPFGQVSRGLGVQVQSAAPIFEIEDVIGKRKSKRPRQEEVFDISF